MCSHTLIIAPPSFSGADVYDRASIFLESLYRDMRKGKCGQNAVIVSHGLFCRLFLTRFYRWKVSHYIIADHVCIMVVFLHCSSSDYVLMLLYT